MIKSHVNFLANLNWNKDSNFKLNGDIALLPTIICSVQSGKIQVIGLVYSSRTSLEQTLSSGKCVFYSRSRDNIWVKSPSGKNAPKLLEIRTDCDQDALVFIVDQRGSFCHRGDEKHNLGCFDATPNLVISPEMSQPLRIAYCVGRQEKITMAFLRSIGIHAYKPHSSRSDEIMVKTHLHPNVQLVGCKPKDVATLMSKGLVDCAVCYNDNFVPGSISHSWKSSSVNKPIKYVVATVPNTSVLDTGIFTLCSEAPPHIVHQWLQKRFRDKYDHVQLLHVHGHAEDLVKKGLADACLVVYETGETIRANEMEIVDHDASNGEFDIMLHVNDDALKHEPRFYREIRNALSHYTIFFYSVDGPNGFMSNFYPCKFVDSQGRSWNSSEHYYQAHKFVDNPIIFEEIKSQPTAKACYKCAWTYPQPSDWIGNKDKYMIEALQYKFDAIQNPRLLQMLLDTGDKYLVEHALKDFHFGCGIDGTGKNRLGHMLMDLRTCARRQHAKL